MKWFQHQANSSLDAKLQEVLLDYGLEGYGLYWYCLELVSMNVDATNLTFELEHDCRIIARNTGSTPQKVTEMMTTFINLGLFDQADGIITCMSLMKKCDEYTNKLLKSNVSGQYRDKVRSNTIEDSTVKENKVDKNIKPLVANAPVEQKKSKFAVPHVGDISNYMNLRGVQIPQSMDEAEKFSDFYASKNWMVGKNKMKDWKAAVRNWLRNYTPPVNPSSETSGWSANMFDANYLEK